jgi:uncharacterized membrane protein HdeD (DUF308 family)
MMALQTQLEPTGSERSPWGLLAVAGIVGAVSGTYVLHDPAAANELVAVSGSVLLGSGLIALGFSFLTLLNRRMARTR